MNSYNSTHAILIVGDFNASLKERTGNAQDRLLIDFVSKNSLGCLQSGTPTFYHPIRLTVPKLTMYTAQQKFSMDFIFVLILVRIRNDFFEVINKYGNP